MRHRLVSVHSEELLTPNTTSKHSQDNRTIPRWIIQNFSHWQRHQQPCCFPAGSASELVTAPFAFASPKIPISSVAFSNGLTTTCQVFLSVGCWHATRCWHFWQHRSQETWEVFWQNIICDYLKPHFYCKVWLDLTWLTTRYSFPLHIVPPQCRQDC